MKQSFPMIDKMLTVTLFLFVASSMFSISISQISAGLGGFLWLLRAYLTNTWKEQRWPLGIPFALFSLASFAAVANAYDVSYSYSSLKKLLEFLIFFWVLNCIRDNNLRNSLFLTLITSATLAGLLGLYQYGQDFNLNYTPSGITYSNRPDGSLSTYMTFAGLLMLAGVTALARVLFQKPMQRWVCVSIGIISLCLFLTLTRQAWFGFLTGSSFLIFYWRKKILLLLPVIVLIVYIASPLTAQKRIQDMFSGEDVTFGMRVTLWKGGWEVFKDYPLTGCGFKCMDLIYSQYPDPTGVIQHLRGMHNNFMQLLMDTGILGLSTWIGIWVCFFVLLYERIKSNKNQSEEWVIYGSSASVIAFLVGGCFETNFYDSEVVMVLYFIMALPFSGHKTNPLLPSQPLV